MIEQILINFPPHVHILTLVSDPDNVLADEQLLSAFAECGFSLVQETDLIRLRQVIGQTRFGLMHPIIVITLGQLNQLPYDLWQQGHKVSLQLGDFFPHLASPIVRQLSSEQRWRLSQAPLPPSRLGEQGTKTYLLQYVFAADLENLKQPAQLIAWLNQYHQQVGKLPPVLADYWLSNLQVAPIYANWPLPRLLASREAFQQFVSEQWGAFVQAETGEQILGETAVRYDVLSFAQDEQLQDKIPALVRAGTLAPVTVSRSERLPVWAKTAVLALDDNVDATGTDELFELLAEQFGKNENSRRWAQWQTVTRIWAELTNIRYKPQTSLSAEQRTTYQTWQRQLDASFYDWLTSYYAPLANKRLPQPHHLYHVPEYIAHQRREGGRVALLVMDGMSLADWLLIRDHWLAQQPGWLFEEHLLLAQVPSVTAVSRQALVSGLRPADFTDSLTHNRHESTHWENFWTRKGLPTSACGYGRLSFNSDTLLPAQATSSRVHILCLINNDIDEMLHGASLGAANVQASLRVWLEQRFSDFFESVHTLLKQGFSVYLTSDHGHVEARGVGQPTEGLAVETRSKRARIYRDENTAVAVQRDYPDTILWHDRGLLPHDVWVLMAKGRTAFASKNEVVVTHGGLTLDEMVVPLVQIKQKA
jgi:hypothetical protein